VNICSYGTGLRLIFAPGLACSKRAMAARKPASSLSVPQVVKVSS